MMFGSAVSIFERVHIIEYINIAHQPYSQLCLGSHQQKYEECFMNTLSHNFFVCELKLEPMLSRSGAKKRARTKHHIHSNKHAVHACCTNCGTRKGINLYAALAIKKRSICYSFCYQTIPNSMCFSDQELRSLPKQTAFCLFLNVDDMALVLDHRSTASSQAGDWTK